MMDRRAGAVACAVAGLMCAAGSQPQAHDGPPFPIVSNRVAGPYEISVWTDPDTTDDGTPGGQFWVTLSPADGARGLNPDTRATVSISPPARQGDLHTGQTEPVRGNVSNQFVALLMDHEGPFDVRVVIDGPDGRAEVAAEVEATYDLRPPAGMLVLYTLPFVLLGGLWLKLLLRRRKKPA